MFQIFSSWRVSRQNLVPDESKLQLIMFVRVTCHLVSWNVPCPCCVCPVLSKHQVCDLAPFLEWTGERRPHTCSCQMEVWEAGWGSADGQERKWWDSHCSTGTSNFLAKLPNLRIISSCVGGKEWRAKHICFLLDKCLTEEAWGREDAQFPFGRQEWREENWWWWMCDRQEEGQENCITPVKLLDSCYFP